MKHLVLTATLVSIAMLAIAVPARGAVIVGSNLASPYADNMPGCNIACTASNLALPAANRAPGGLTSPVNGAVTAWRVRANTGLNLSLRVLRPVSGTTFTGAGTSAPASFGGPGVSPFFSTSVPIGIGDSIGLNSPNGNLILGATAGATQLYWNVPPLANGSTRPATAAGNNREVLVQALVEPSNTLTFGKLKRKKKKGIAKLKIMVPNAGVLRFGGKKVKVAGGARTIGAPGEITVKIKAKGKKRKRLKKNGKVKVKPLFFFTPTNGNENRQPRKFRLKRKLRK